MLSYYIATAQIAIYGYGGAVCRASEDGCKTAIGFPGWDTDSTMSYEEAVRQMELLPSRLQSGEAYRNNELGNLRINSYVWPNIALGANESIHSRLRPIYDDLWGAGARTWSAESVRKSARTYLARVSNTFTVPEDVAKWVELELHNITLGMDLSEEQLGEIVDFQAAILPLMAMPEILNPILRAQSSITQLLDKRQQLIAEYSQAITNDRRGLFSDVSAEFRPVVASSLVDALTFAGGLSIPHALKTTLALVYSDQSPASHFKNISQMNDRDLEAFVYEALRLLTPVIEFPWIDAATNQRKLMIQMKSLRDVTIWGEDADKFSLRSLETYRKYSGIGWVEPANGLNRRGSRWVSMHDSRGCPGQDLSLAMIVAFMQEWRSMHHQWHVAEMPSGGITFAGSDYHTPPVASPFVLQRGLA